jgi:hypothetical protein
MQASTQDQASTHPGMIHHIIALPRMHQQAEASKGEEGAWRAAHLLAGAATFEDDLKEIHVLRNVV